jgi:RNA-directed DNA polymerase
LATAVAVPQWYQHHRYDAVADQAAALNRKLRGHYKYYGRPTNYHALWQFHRMVRRVWERWLKRGTRGKTLTWDDFAHLLTRHPLLRPRITHA